MKCLAKCLPWHGSARALPHYRLVVLKKSCLRTLLWKQCSYIFHKSTSCDHIEPFLRYMWFKGRFSESSWLGWTVDFREWSRGQFFFIFFSTGFFCFFVFLPLHHFFPFARPFTSISPLCSTCPPCIRVFHCVCPIFPPTFLHHARPCPPVVTP